MTIAPRTGSLGAVTRELIREAIVATCEQMSLAVIRTSHSETVKSAMDFSTAICDATGEMVGQGVTLPNQLGAIPDAVASIFRAFRDDLNPGDVVILNDPFAGGTHLPDIYVIAPVFYDARLIALIATVAHHADLGGSVAGSMAPDSYECYQEGLRIPPVKFYERGKPNAAVHAMIRANCRIPDVVLGDFAAQVVACRTGEAGLLKLVGAYGLETLLEHLRDLLDYTERLTRAEIRSLPDGTYRYTDYMDDDGFRPEPIPISVKITIRDDEIEADFEGSSPQLPVSLNSTLSFTKSCVYYALRTLMRTDIPHNAGFFRAITVKAPPGTILNCVLPAATATRGLTGFRVADTVFGALAQALPDRVMGASDGGLTLVGIAGQKANREAFTVLELLSGAWGGRSDRDGVDGVANLGANISNIPIEMLESAYPVRIEQYGFVPDTGGAGQFRGGLSTVRDYRLLQDGVLDSPRRPPEDHAVRRGGRQPGYAVGERPESGGRAREAAVEIQPFDQRRATSSAMSPPVPVAGAIRSSATQPRSPATSATRSSRRSMPDVNTPSWWAPTGRWTSKRRRRAASQVLDALLRGGTVIDGTGGPLRVADVGVQNGHIVAIGNLADAEAAQRFDVSGLAVAPGFIDIHSHSDATLLVDPRARSSIAQGVTTEVVGNCGHAPAPLADASDVPDLVFGYNPALQVDWTSVDGYLQALARARPAVNVATLAGHIALRLAVLGRAPRPATPEELDRMVGLLGEAFDAGAFGLSSGLEYPLGLACTTDELVMLAREAGRRGGFYAIHTRDRDFGAVEAFDEAFDIGRRAEVPLQVSHLTPRYGAPRDAAARALEAIDAARARGQDVACDQHTRLHGLTKLVTMLPPSALEGGTPELLRRLRDPDTRAEYRAFPRPLFKMGLMNEWERMALFEARCSSAWVGKDFQTIGEQRGQHPMYAILDILLEAGDDAPNVLVTGLVHTEDELEQTFVHPSCMPESDATALAIDGPLAGQSFLGAFTWAAYYLRRFVRERASLSLAEGIHRLTQLPATRLGLADRGVVREGAWADLVVLDPATIAERGTLQLPNQYATGVHHVLVNGVIALRDGAFTDERTGTVLRR